ncbi:gtpase binding protein rid1 [Colletotrichum asianum]
MHLTEQEQDLIPEPVNYQKARRLNRENRRRKHARGEQQQQQQHPAAGPGDENVAPPAQVQQQQQQVPATPRPLDGALVPASRRDHRLIDAKEMNELLEACLDRRNVPEDQRRMMRTQTDEVKMACIQQCWADMSKQQPQAAPMPTLVDPGAVIAIPGDGSGSSKTSSNNTTVHNYKYTVNNNNHTTNSNSTVNHYDAAGAGNPPAETVAAAASPALLPTSSPPATSPSSTGTAAVASSWKLAATGYWLLCWGPYFAGAFGLVWLYMSITSWTAAIGASLAQAGSWIPSLPSLPSLLSWLSTSSSSAAPNATPTTAIPVSSTTDVQVKPAREGIIGAIAMEYVVIQISWLRVSLEGIAGDGLAKRIADVLLNASSAPLSLSIPKTVVEKARDVRGHSDSLRAEEAQWLTDIHRVAKRLIREIDTFPASEISDTDRGSRVEYAIEAIQRGFRDLLRREHPLPKPLATVQRRVTMFNSMLVKAADQQRDLIETTNGWNVLRDLGDVKAASCGVWTLATDALLAPWSPNAAGPLGNRPAAAAAASAAAAEDHASESSSSAASQHRESLEDLSRVSNLGCRNARLVTQKWEAGELRARERLQRLEHERHEVDDLMTLIAERASPAEIEARLRVLLVKWTEFWL